MSDLTTSRADECLNWNWRIFYILLPGMYIIEESSNFSLRNVYKARPRSQLRSNGKIFEFNNCHLPDHGARK